MEVGFFSFICINSYSSTHVVVRTKLDGDFKPLAAKSLTISVRCYETRVGRINVVQSNILVEYTKVLWSKQDGVEYEPIGNLDLPFRISIPAKVAGFSTAAFVDYRCVWRLEAGTICCSCFFTFVHLIFPPVLNHVPISGIGARQIRHFELPFIRYDVPIYSPITPPTPPLLNLQTNKPRAPRIRYSIHSPQIPIGPHDLVSVSIHLLPVDHGVSIRSTSLIVERRIQLHDQTPCVSGSTPMPQTPITPRSTSSSPKQLPTPCPKSPYSPTAPCQEDPLFDAVSSTPSLSSSTSTTTLGTALSSSLTLASESTPLLHPNSSASTKLVVNPIAGTESSGNLFRDENGVWSRTLTLQWPAVKSHSLWAVGETISSELVTVKYFVRTKVCFSPCWFCPSSDLSAYKFQIIVSFPSGTESIDLAEQELLVISTNEAERQLALANYNELNCASVRNTTRSKSKSPRRTRPNPEEPLPVPPVVVGANSYGKPRSRRPHTSAGPRDKPVNFAGGTYGHSHAQEGGESSTANISGEDIGSSSGHGSKRRSELVTPSTTLRPDSREAAAKQPRLDGWKPHFWPTNRVNNSISPRLKNASSTSTTASSSSNSNSGPEEDGGLREWQEELEKNEKKSRKPSDLLGFFKRKRSEGAL